MIKGEAKISGYNSVLTAQVDQNSALNTGKPVAQWTPDLFREFAWNGSALTQVAFPGIFPDLTRYQAEADQASVNQGHQPWKNDAVQVATALETQFLNWQRPVTAKLLSGGGPQDVTATVQVLETAVQGSTPTIVVTLSRLEGNTHNIWIATGVADGSLLTLKNLAPRQLISSPVTLEGTGSAFEAVIGQAVIYDHLFRDIGHAQITSSSGMGMGTYTTPVSYTTSFAGIQEGVVAVYHNNGGLSAEKATAVIMKVLLNPAQQTLRVSSVDLVVSPSSIAGLNFGSSITLTYTATFHVQAGATGGTIEFLYTWNNGRASPSGSVNVPPNGPSTVTFTYIATGRLGGAYAFPGVAQMNVTSPNVVQSNQVIPSGDVRVSTVPSADSAPMLVPFNGTAYVGWTSMNADHNLALATYDTTKKGFGSPIVLTDRTLAGAGPSLEVFNSNLYVAWLGTDGHLNVARYNPADPTRLADKVTLNETSADAPSLAAFNGRLYLGWRGTDGHLNLVSSADTAHFDTRAPYDVTIRTSPTLVATPFYLFVGWEETGASSSIVIGRYDPSNSADLHAVVTTASSQLPIGLTFAGNAGYPGLRVAWRTPDDAHINLGLFGGSPVLQGIVPTAQTTLYGPMLTVAGRGGPFLSWTGTDTAQTVNVSPVNI